MTRRRSRPRLVGTLAALLLCAAGTSYARVSPRPISLEYRVKATYLYKLAPFVDWPPTAFVSASAPFVICVVGRDPFHDFLVRAVTGKRFGSHPFIVRKLRTLGRRSGCHIVFISAMHGARLRRVLATVAGEPVLTVTDSVTDPRAPSIIHFVIERGHIRFDIDLDAAARNHLRISSKLLHLAVAVEG